MGRTRFDSTGVNCGWSIRCQQVTATTSCGTSYLSRCAAPTERWAGANAVLPTTPATPVKRPTRRPSSLKNTSVPRSTIATTSRQAWCMRCSARSTATRAFDTRWRWLRLKWPSSMRNCGRPTLLLNQCSVHRPNVSPPRVQRSATSVRARLSMPRSPTRRTRCPMATAA